MKTNLLNTLAVALCFLCFAACDKGNEATSIEKFYGGDKMDTGECIQISSDGGFIIAGSTESSGAGSSDAYLIKINDSGRRLWSKTYGGEYDEGASCVRQTVDGGYIIAGYKNSPGILDANAYLIKTDKDGNMQWESTYPGNEGTRCKSVIQCDDNGYIMVGSESVRTFNSTFSLLLIIKTDEAGNMVWTKTYSGLYSAGGNSIIQTGSNDFIICGETSGPELEKMDVYLIKINGNGDTLWTRTYGGENNRNAGYSVSKTTDQGLIICGYTNYSDSLGSGKADVLLIRTNENGDTLWTKTYGGIGDDYGFSVTETKDGGLVLCGSTESFGAGNVNVYLVKTDDLGEMLWSKTFGGPQNDTGAAVCQTGNGDYVIAGSTASYGAGDYDVYFIKTSRD